MFMSGSRIAIERLKTTIKSFYTQIAEEKNLLLLVGDMEEILDQTLLIATEKELKLESSILESAIPLLVDECIKEMKIGSLANTYLKILKIKDIIIACYFLVSKDELKINQLSEDIKSLSIKRDALEEHVSNYEKLVNLSNHLKSSNEDLLVITGQVKARNEAVGEILNDAKIKLTVIEDIFVSVEEAESRQNIHIEELKKLSDQSTEMSERIKGILSDVNRDSMAASFKERKEELDKSIKNYDRLNYAALFLILIFSVLLFFIPILRESSGIDVKFIYERFLIILPLGFISWFASRRSQYLFQLREDYAYKYSSAMAFEGYKRQAEANPEMHDELLKIAITNLGKTPVSVFDKDLKHAPTDKVVDTIKDAIPKIK